MPRVQWPHSASAVRHARPGQMAPPCTRSPDHPPLRIHGLRPSGQPSRDTGKRPACPDRSCAAGLRRLRWSPTRHGPANPAGEAPVQSLHTGSANRRWRRSFFAAGCTSANAPLHVRSEVSNPSQSTPAPGRFQRPKSQRMAQGLLAIAVGMPVTRHPPHRSVRAQLRHTAPTSGI